MVWAKRCIGEYAPVATQGCRDRDRRKARLFHSPEAEGTQHSKRNRGQDHNKEDRDE